MSEATTSPLSTGPVYTLTKEGYPAISSCIRCCSHYPVEPHYCYYRTYPQFGIVTARLDNYSNLCCNKILNSVQMPILLQSIQDDYNEERLMNANDAMLQQSFTLMDVASGIVNKIPNTLIVNPELPGTSSSANISSWNTRATANEKKELATIYAPRNIIKPQLMFKDTIDNRNDTLWVPKIKFKPNEIKPLCLTLIYIENKLVGYAHPYNAELNSYHAPKKFLEPDNFEPAIPKTLDQTDFLLVDTLEKLEYLTKCLEGVDEIAIDLEHHSYRTYQGITCLMQISTVGQDFIVDTLALREHLHLLNQAFTDPDKLKILHGADNDIIWLQRDFGIYIVGLFDTHQAAKLLNLPGLSLKALLSSYCEIEINKKYQLADWRIRPLPNELVTYARMDTHYLLYLWRRLKADLLRKSNGANGLLLATFEASKHVCKQTYTKEVLTETSHMLLYEKSKKSFNTKQLTALKMLYGWRDHLARLEDESIEYVLPSHMLLTLSEMLPRELQGILAFCTPTPPLVRQHLHQIHKIILTCREVTNLPQLYQMPASISTMAAQVIKEDSNKSHDHHQHPDFRDNMSTLIQDNSVHINNSEDSRLPCQIHVYDSKSFEEYKLGVQLDRENFVQPFHRYHKYREIAQIDEIREYKKREAKIKALNKDDNYLEKVINPVTNDQKLTGNENKTRVEAHLGEKKKRKVEPFIVEKAPIFIAQKKAKSKNTEHLSHSSKEELAAFNYNIADYSKFRCETKQSKRKKKGRKH